MKILIIYADKKTRMNQRTLKVDAPQIKGKKLSFKEMDLCERVSNFYKKIDEVIMSWKVVEE